MLWAYYLIKTEKEGGEETVLWYLVEASGEASATRKVRNHADLMSIEYPEYSWFYGSLRVVKPSGVPSLLGSVQHTTSLDGAPIVQGVNRS